jgi:hypothetical protein
MKMNIICSECNESRLNRLKVCPDCKQSKHIREFVRQGIARQREFPKCVDCSLEGTASYIRGKERQRIRNESNTTSLSMQYLSKPLIG